ncbi:DUF4450 domain-containing protein [Microbacter margulisiae]|uniref:DUF4450 domain-containing protein n=1 Tax=Microbacter margulisiae TaxID=1350067 RepID=A0A7W5DQ22_9PORP|nr:DUF4450 domain-containing protein [Microbacter margulisiae]MBB3186972.1 hypothetical protein [Microbacter margulisiae]
MILFVWACVALNGKAQNNRYPYNLNTRTYSSCIKGASSPDLSFYIPGLAGNIKFGLIQGKASMWLSDMKTICMSNKNELHYSVTGGLLKQGALSFTIYALLQTDGIIMQIEGCQLPDSIQLFWAFGGASGKTIQQSPPGLNADDCLNNVFIIERNSEFLYYPTLPKFGVIHALFPIQTTARIADAREQTTPLLFFNSGGGTKYQALTGTFVLKTGCKYYIALYRPSPSFDVNYYMLPSIFSKLEAQ